MNWKRFAVLAAVLAAGAGLITFLIVRGHQWRPRSISIQGAVVRRDQDPRRQLPIAGVAVTATDGLISTSTESDSSGYFDVKFSENVWPRSTVQMSFRNPGYAPLDMQLPIGIHMTTQKLYVAMMLPLAEASQPAPNQKAIVVGSIRVRYTENTQGDENIASAAKTFQVVNKGNVPCNGQTPCSPDGLWKAATSSVTLDAGPSDVFRNVRASCIAGPCPFTRMDSSAFSHGGRIITAKALDWSDTATFLLEAEVYRVSIGSSVRESFPVIFGRTLNFTLPPTQEGVSIEADLDGVPMVFPLGPEVYLSWANCNVRTNQDGEKSTVYRCELKPGYRF